MVVPVSIIYISTKSCKDTVSKNFSSLANMYTYISETLYVMQYYDINMKSLALNKQFSTCLQAQLEKTPENDYYSWNY